MGLHYRELTVWRKAMDLAKGVYRLAPALPREETYGMRSQITRAATSIPANIAEGWTRETEKDRAHFLAIAQGSLAETETLLTLCEEIGWFPPEKTSTVRGLITEVGKILSTLRRKMRTPS
ncbi:MAG: four helix bundle protein [Thermoanaerobaculia bacterium]